MINFEEWEGFEGRIWKEEVNVRDFIQKNYTPYDGDESFLADPTEATNKLWGTLQKLQKEERAKGGVLDMETEVVSSLHHLRLPAQRGAAQDLYRLHPHPQPGRFRRLHPGDEESTPHPHHHRPARHLRPRPYRGRLPPCGPVWHRRPDPVQAGGSGQLRRRHHDR